MGACIYLPAFFLNTLCCIVVWWLSSGVVSFSGEYCSLSCSLHWRRGGWEERRPACHTCRLRRDSGRALPSYLSFSLPYLACMLHALCSCPCTCCLVTFAHIPPLSSISLLLCIFGRQAGRQWGMDGMDWTGLVDGWLGWKPGGGWNRQ